MWYATIRNAMATCTLAAALLAAPAESRACCGWLFGGWGAQSTYNAPAWGASYAPAYAPVYASASTCGTCAPQSCAPVCSPAPCNSCTAQPATTYYSGSTCNSCTAQPTTAYYSGSTCSSCTTQTVRYMPQTSYRTVYRAVPVTTYQAFIRPGFLTGWPVTTYRPVTTWTYQAMAVPQTTYRPICADACGTSAVSSGCSSCGTGTVVNGATGGTGSSDGSPYYPPSDGSTYDAGAGGGAPQTFQEQGGTSIEADKPIPDPTTRSIPGPSLTDPASRTTLRPIHQAVHYVPVVKSSPATDSGPALDAGGWSVSRD